MLNARVYVHNNLSHKGHKRSTGKNGDRKKTYFVVNPV